MTLNRYQFNVWAAPAGPRPSHGLRMGVPRRGRRTATLWPHMVPPSPELLRRELDGAPFTEPAELLARLGLAGFVDVVHARRSYTWELMRLIESRVVEGRCRPFFDLCFVDGAHTWDTDGLAFFLVEKLLRPGGWVVFD